MIHTIVKVRRQSGHSFHHLLKVAYVQQLAEHLEVCNGRLTSRQKRRTCLHELLVEIREHVSLLLIRLRYDLHFEVVELAFLQLGAYDCLTVLDEGLAELGLVPVKPFIYLVSLL